MMTGLLSLIFAALLWGLLGLAWLLNQPAYRALPMTAIAGQIIAQGRATIAAKHNRTPTILFTLITLLFLFPLADNALDPKDSTTARVIWMLTIGPHEMGHFVCLPFGRFIMVAGGSVWQSLFWLLLGGWALVVRRQVFRGLMLWQIVGHSFLNMSVYIGDAQERELDLIFGLDKDAHDWWYLLGRVGLLHYDNFFADISVFIGVFITLGVIGAILGALWRNPT